LYEANELGASRAEEWLGPTCQRHLGRGFECIVIRLRSSWSADPLAQSSDLSWVHLHHNRTFFFERSYNRLSEL